MLRPVVLICLATSFPLVMLLESTLKHPLGLRGLLADGAIAEVLAPYLVALIAPLLSWFLLLEVNRRGGLYAELPLLLIAGAANEILLQQSVRSTLARADLVGTRTES